MHTLLIKHHFCLSFVSAISRSSLTRPIAPSAAPRLSTDLLSTRTMASTAPSNSFDDFHALLSQSSRVLALLGAGLSASSGLPTFRGAGGLWRSHDATSLATPQAFAQDTALVWRFYSYRRHMALSVEPNPAHYALAELARRMRGFNCLSQNVDGLSQRSSHPRGQLQLLHGTLFEGACGRLQYGIIER